VSEVNKLLKQHLEMQRMMKQMTKLREEGPDASRPLGPDAAALRGSTMLDHVSLGVTDLERSKAFYDAS
jgi:hypothetical protein